MMAAAGAHTLLEQLPAVRGRLERDAPLTRYTWFRTGGPAEILFDPADVEDLQQMLGQLPPGIPVHVIGVGSNLLVRDGGVPGVVIRLGKAFRDIRVEDDCLIRVGGGAQDIAVANAAQKAGIAGLEFLRGIPGLIGAGVRMNAGAYGQEFADILISCEAVDTLGERHLLPVERLDFGYRHSSLPAGWIVVSALLRGRPGDPQEIAARMRDITGAREATQPVRSRTGGSTFRNPPGHKAWELIDAAGCRGLTRGGAQISEQHANFMINTGNATAADLEWLGEEVRQRVKAKTGVTLEWEIERIGIRTGSTQR